MGKFADHIKAMREKDERNTVDGFTPRGISAERVDELYHDCLPDEGTPAEECVSFFNEQKENGFDHDAGWTVFSLAKLKEHRRDIMYYLGQLYPVHNSNGHKDRYMNLWDMKRDYRNNAWCEDIDSVLKLIKLGYASVDDCYVPMVSCPIYLDEKKYGFKYGCVNCYVPETLHPYLDPEFDDIWELESELWTKDGSSYSEYYFNGRDEANTILEDIYFGSVVLLGMLPNVRQKQKDGIRNIARTYHMDARKYPKLAENIIKIRIGSGTFEPMELNESAVNALFDLCLATEETSEENATGMYFYRKSNGYSESCMPESLGNVFFDKVKLQKYYKHIAYLLGQLYDIHKTRDCYLYLKNFGLNYKGEPWTISEGSDRERVIFKLVALGYHAEDEDEIKLISAPYKKNDACINIRIPKTFSPKDKSNYESWLNSAEAEAWRKEEKRGVSFEIKRDDSQYFEKEDPNETYYCYANGRDHRFSFSDVKSMVTRYDKLSKEDRDILFEAAQYPLLPKQIYADFLNAQQRRSWRIYFVEEYDNDLRQIHLTNACDYQMKMYLHRYTEILTVPHYSKNGPKTVYFSPEKFRDYLITYPNIWPKFLSWVLDVKPMVFFEKAKERYSYLSLEEE